MNIVLYKGNFSYNVVNYFVDELGKALERMGNNIQILDLNVGNTDELISKVNEIYNKKIDLVLAYNGIDLVFDKRFYNALGIVVGNLFVDHPLYHIQRLNACIDKKNMFCGIYDEGAINTIERYLNSNLNLTHFMHGGSYSKNIYSQRKYDVVVVGGLKSSNDSILEELDRVNCGNVKNIVNDIYDKINKNYSITLDEYINEELLKYNISKELLNTEELSLVVQYIYNFIDSKMRYKIRYQAISELINNGIKVDYFGNCDENLFYNNKNFINHGAKDYEEILEIMAESKIIVNDLTYFKNGSHERVFSAMLNKALVISNINNYSHNMYKDNESIVFYDVNKENDLVEKVKYFLNNEQERNRIIENAYEITSTYNTWDNRADEILQIYRFMKDNMN